MARRIKEVPAYVYYYKETRFSAWGIVATLLGLLSLAAMGVLTWYMIRFPDQAGDWIGAAGFTAFAAAFLGMTEGLSSFRDNCRSYLFSKIGTLLCGFMVAAWFLLFCVGLAGA